MTAIVNDTTLAVKSYNVTLKKSIVTVGYPLWHGFTDSVFYSCGNKELTINIIDSSGKKLSIGIGDWRDSTIGNGFRTGSYSFNASQDTCNIPTCTGAYAEYNGIAYGNQNTGSGAVIITACDAVNHLISGTFSGSLPLYTGTGNPLLLNSGTFTNLSYTIVQ